MIWALLSMPNTLVTVHFGKPSPSIQRIPCEQAQNLSHRVLALPPLSVPDGDGLTDWDMASMYGKLGICLFSAWSGPEGGITAGLVGT